MTSTLRLFAVACTLSFGANLLAALPARGDPPPWAGKWKHKHEHRHDRDGDDDDDDRHRGRERGDDGRCQQYRDRISFNRSKIREIEPTGRHRKALQWYKDDTVNALRDLDDCRRGR